MRPPSRTPPEVRVRGRLSQRVRAAFPDMVLVEMPAETVITGWSDASGARGGEG